jgi:hypothetical protein
MAVFAARRPSSVAGMSKGHAADRPPGVEADKPDPFAFRHFRRPAPYPISFRLLHGIIFSAASPEWVNERTRYRGRRQHWPLAATNEVGTQVD